MDNQEEEHQQQRSVLPAQELSEDDDLCSYIFIDQLGVLPGARLGVYPQQLDFAGPSFEPQTVLSILHDTLFRGLSDDSGSRINDAINRFSELPIIKVHLESRATPSARDRFKEHLKRYLITLQPRSKVEIHTTDQYAGFSDRTQLAVFATRHIPSGTTLLELQGRRVALPVEWLTDEDGAKARRRNDFSLIRSGRKGKNGDQLFLGTARFVNHDCTPNVRLEARDKYVTYQSIREIKVGEEILAFYGDGYFGPDNCDCLCLTCKTNGAGGFAKMAATLPNGGVTHDPPSPAGPSRLSTAASIDVQTPDDVNPLALPVTVVGVEDAAPSEHTHDDEEEDSDAESEDFAPRRSKRESALGWKPGHFALRKKQKRRIIEDHGADGDDDEEPPDDTTRCVTCIRLLDETPITFEDRTFDHHCKRCVRHALIFNLPWPHRRREEVQDWPPIHLLPDPNGRLPRKISSVPLPSLGLHPEPPVLPESLLPIAKERFTFPLRRSILHREKYTMDEYIVDQLRLAAVTEAEHEEQLALAREEAKRNKQAARKAREEKKEKRSAGKIKGSGVWSYYEIMTDEEIKRREEERNRMTSGTRRGGRFKAGDGEETELIRQAQIRAREKNEAKQRREENEAGRKVERKARGRSVSASDDTPASDPVDAGSSSTSTIDDHPSAALANWVDSPDASLLDDETTDDDEDIQFISISQAQDDVQYLRTTYVGSSTTRSPLATKDEPSPTKPHSTLPPSPPQASSSTGFPSAKAGPSTVRRSLPSSSSSSSMRPPSPIKSPVKPAKPSTSAPVQTSPNEISPNSSVVPRKRGRPPGTGKWQKLRAEEARLTSSAEGSSTPSQSPEKGRLHKDSTEGRDMTHAARDSRTEPSTVSPSSGGIATPFPVQRRAVCMSSTNVTRLASTAPRQSTGNQVPITQRKSSDTSIPNGTAATPAKPASDASFLNELLQSARSSLLPAPRDPLLFANATRRYLSNTARSAKSTPSAPTGARQLATTSVARSSIPKPLSTTPASTSATTAAIARSDTNLSHATSTASSSTAATSRLVRPGDAPGSSKIMANGASATIDSNRPAAVPQKRPYFSVLVDEDIFVDEPKKASNGPQKDVAVASAAHPFPKSPDASSLLVNGIKSAQINGSSSGQLAEYARRVSTSPTDAARILLAQQQSEMRKRRIVEIAEGRNGRNSRSSTPQSSNGNGTASSTPATDAFSLGPRVRLSNGQFGSGRASPVDTLSAVTSTPEKPRTQDPPAPQVRSFNTRNPVTIGAKPHVKPRMSVSSSTKTADDLSKPTDSWRPLDSGTLVHGSSTGKNAPLSPSAPQHAQSLPNSTPASRSARISSVEIPQKPISPSRFYGSNRIIATVSAPSKETERTIHQSLRRVDHYQPGGASEPSGSGTGLRRTLPASSSSTPSSASENISTHSSTTSRPHPASPSDTPDSDLDDLEVDSHLDSIASVDSYAVRRTSPLKRRSLESTGQSTISTACSPGRSPLHDADVPGPGSPLFTPPSSPPKAGAAPFPIAPSTAFPGGLQPQDSWKAPESPLRSPTATLSPQRSTFPLKPSNGYSGSRVSAGSHGGPNNRSPAQSGNLYNLDADARKAWERVDLFRYPGRSTDTYTPTAGSSTAQVNGGTGRNLSGTAARNPKDIILRYNPYHRLPRPEVHAGSSSDRSSRPNRDKAYSGPRGDFDLARMDSSTRPRFQLADWPSRRS